MRARESEAIPRTRPSRRNGTCVHVYSTVVLYSGQERKPAFLSSLNEWRPRWRGCVRQGMAQVSRVLRPFVVYNERTHKRGQAHLFVRTACSRSEWRCEVKLRLTRKCTGMYSEVLTWDWVRGVLSFYKTGYVHLVCTCKSWFGFL